MWVFQSFMLMKQSFKYHNTFFENPDTLFIYYILKTLWRKISSSSRVGTHPIEKEGKKSYQQCSNFCNRFRVLEGGSEEGREDLLNRFLTADQSKERTNDGNGRTELR